MKDDAAANGRIFENGTWKKLVAGLSKKRNMPDDCVIKCDTIRRRLSRHRLVVYQLESLSPLAEIELIIVTIIIQMAHINLCLHIIVLKRNKIMVSHCE